MVAGAARCGWGALCMCAAHIICLTSTANGPSSSQAAKRGVAVNNPQLPHDLHTRPQEQAPPPLQASVIGAGQAGGAAAGGGHHHGSHLMERVGSLGSPSPLPQQPPPPVAGLKRGECPQRTSSNRVCCVPVYKG